MIRELKQTLIVFAVLTLITGVAYPGVVWVFAQLVVPERATGSVIEVHGKAVGSQLLGQTFSSPRYFWGRPSATGPFPTNGAVSSGSNQAATNPNLVAAVHDRIAALRAADPGNTAAVPIDLVTASGSGLDPQISPAAAEYQVRRVARERGLPAARVRELVAAATAGRTLGFLGEPRVNVLELNIALDAQDTQAK
ncbi:MAG TPA: potassium-transporting ATPase subunit KdpC [Steroidobacteraceae bacterium]|nr:potassium-transporting ATPase subunit KdpC [Steroidobacteraceae bacterium]